jgi:hypothetical protein
MDSNFIEFYGYTPFPLFQQVILLAQILLTRYADPIKIYLKDFCEKYLGDSEYYTYVYKTMLSIPLVLIVYYDTRYSSFSLKNLGVPSEYNRYINQVLFILGSYGIIQVLGQDAGLQTGIDQRDIVQLTIVFAVLCVGMAYSITENRSQSIIAMFLYFHLRYVVSDKASNVCFESLGDSITDEQADADAKFTPAA